MRLGPGGSDPGRLDPRAGNLAVGGVLETGLGNLSLELREDRGPDS